ncbi:immunoglobulin superfamily member 10-like [Trichoplusia ni]|uniref:Hemolin n=1 Tax=Trichoplusia ni TaxID=7111 RepID=A0A7E5W6S9_TRINI|nr:immunoglobulin superfamily member 10-like [Trichoplusia ni]
MKEVINVKWTDVTTSETFIEYKQMSFTVGAFTKTAMIVASGENPKVEISAPDNSSISVEKIVDLRNTQVVQLKEAKAGDYTVITRSRGPTSVTLYKSYKLPVEFGFSPRMPRSMNETSEKPMPGRKNYILIDNAHSNMKLEKLEIQYSNDSRRETLDIKDTGTEGFYWTEVLVVTDTTFRIWIQGHDTTSYQEIKGCTEIIIPQQTGMGFRRTSPKCQILDQNPLTVEFGKSATIACKVTGYPTPSISWNDDNMGMSLSPENLLLEIPALYISYVNIENPTTNTTVYCKPRNIEGEDLCSLNVFVHRPYTFNVIQTPTDQSLEYGSEGKLYCEVSAYPEAVIKWYHNDTEVYESDEIQVLNEEKALWIKNMTLNTVGNYKCEVKNEANFKSFSALVEISGIDPPEVKVEKENIVLKPGDWSSLECSIIKGNPSPTITWTYKSEDAFDFSSLPDGVVADNDRLKIGAAQSEHKGDYKCTAENIAGQSTAVITVQLQYPPTILSMESNTQIVKEEDEVALPCNATGAPAPTVRWEMTQDDVMVLLDERHHTDSQNTHRFKALSRDSGNYHCIAENDVGRAELTITVDVQVAPYIDPPKSKLVILRSGDSVVLPCDVKYGNPVPTAKWVFIAVDSTTKIIARNKAARPLHLTNVNYTNEGTYLCIADNDVGTDSIKIYVKIQ